MKYGAIVVVCSAFSMVAGLSAVAQAVAAATPVTKVIEMLQAMKTKGQGMLESESQTFAAYTKWVGDRSAELTNEIKTAERAIADLTATIEKANNEVSVLANEIAELDGEIVRMEGEQKHATAVRDEERAAFEAVEKDYSESVDALDGAIKAVAAQHFDREQAESFLQRTGAHRAIEAFSQLRDDEVGAPAVAAYETQTGSVLEVLKQLHEKFRGMLNDAVNAESEKAHSYDLVMLHLGNFIRKSSADRTVKIVEKAKTAEFSASAQGKLSDVRGQKAEDEKFLSDMRAQFLVKQGTFDENQKIRKEELEAIAKAIEIMSSSEVSGSYSEHINFLQRSPKSFLQTRSHTRRMSTRQLASRFLARSATKLSSARLSSVASVIERGPFDKVTEMIQNLLAKLKEEALQEADHHKFCEEELKNNKLKREELASEQERLMAEVQSLDGKIKALGEAIAVSLKEQEELTTSMSEATAQRRSESSKNAETIADAKAGVEALQRALVVLREFYSKQTALLQARTAQVPDIQAYKGLTGEKGGVIGMLEVIESDFARLEAETTAAETQAASEYKSFMEDAEADKKMKHEAEVKDKLEKDQTEFELSQTEKELGQVELKLQKATAYFEELKPMCVTIHVSYEERVGGRQKEIDALKQAYELLDAKA